ASVGAVRLERLVRLLLDEARSRCAVDCLLEPRALVVEPIDGARELDERIAEIATRLAFADGILDVPQRLVDLLELGAEPVPPPAIGARELDRTQGATLPSYILELSRFLDALLFYFEDRDFIHELARRDRHENILRRRVPGGAHVPPAFSGAPFARST